MGGGGYYRQVHYKGKARLHVAMQIAEHSVKFLWVLVQLGELHLVKTTLSCVAIIDMITSHNSQAIAI